MKLTALALAAALLAAPSIGSAATAPAKPAAGAPKLEVQLAAKLLDFIDYKNSVRRGMQSSGLPPELVAVRPDWTPIFKAAMTEELDHDMPVLESMLGSALGKTFTEDEMKAGLLIVSDQNLRAIYIAANSGAPEPPVQMSKATEALLDTPAGGSFANKLQTINSVLDPVQVEVMATVMPGVMRRFGEKAEAAEIAHRAAAGYAAAK